jgi:hypothetical protein
MVGVDITKWAPIGLTGRPVQGGEQHPFQESCPCKEHGDARLLSEDDEDFGKLAEKCRQLAERFHRLGAVAFDSTSSAGFKRWGEDLMAQAAALDQAKGTAEGGADEG